MKLPKLKQEIDHSYSRSVKSTKLKPLLAVKEDDKGKRLVKEVSEDQEQTPVHGYNIPTEDTAFSHYITDPNV